MLGEIALFVDEKRKLGRFETRHRGTRINYRDNKYPRLRTSSAFESVQSSSSLFLKINWLSEHPERHPQINIIRRMTRYKSVEDGTNCKSHLPRQQSHNLPRMMTENALYILALHLVYLLSPYPLQSSEYRKTMDVLYVPYLRSIKRKVRDLFIWL